MSLSNQRRLAAIMFTDMVGYTALSQKNEASALQLLAEHRKIVRPFFPKFNGLEIKTIGDSFLVEFASALEAVRCAFEIQRSLREQNSDRSNDEKFLLRIGIHLGDVIHDRDDVYGDAVNIASRIEPLAEPGGVCITEQVYHQVRNKLDFPFSSLGRKELKNVSHSIEVFKAVLPWDDRSRSSDLDVHRIAVMPFANMSRDPGDEYFADGMTEELISSISNIGGLSVISRTSALKFKGGGKTVAEIGQELKAGTLLEGSVRKADNLVRVTAQLIDVNTDQHLWSQSYDRELKNTFAIQSEIAKNVADSVRVRIMVPELNRIEKKPTENTTAYTLYLKGRYFWNKRGLEEIKKAAEYFEESIREDANFALGYVGLADCHEILTTNFEIDILGNHEKAKEEIAKAMELDEGLAEAHATRGLILQNEYKLSQAEKEFKKAIELKPSYAPAYLWYSHLLRNRMRWDEALKHIQKAVELDPFSQVINMNHAFFYFVRRDFQRGLELAFKATELDLNAPQAHFDLLEFYARLKMFDDLHHELKIVVGLLQGQYPYVATTAAAITAYFEGDNETLRRLLPELEARVGEPWTAGTLNMAAICFRLGDNDRGFEWLEKSYARREFGLLYLGLDDFFDGIRGDPRYQTLLKKIEMNDTEI